jgi:hypothetical protein
MKVPVAAALWLLAGPALAEEQNAAVPTEQVPAEQKPNEASPVAIRPDDVAAIWKTQEINFYFQSFSTLYSCTGLERKFERLMQVLGTQAEVSVHSPECPNDIARMPRVTMVVTAPIVATPEALAEREKNKSRHDLAARVTGRDPNEGMELFPAYWQRVSLNEKLRLEPGDCEFIEEFRRKVLPKLAVKIANAVVLCSPNSASLVRPKMEIDVLRQVPPPDAKVPAEAGAPAKKPGGA